MRNPPDPTDRIAEDDWQPTPGPDRTDELEY